MTPARLDVLSVQGKLRLLAELVDDLDAVGDVDGARLQRDRLLRRAVERILTQLVDLAASVCSHVASTRLPTAAGSYRGAFDDAAAVGLLDTDLAASLRAAAGMRNLLVHEYARVDLDLVAQAVPQARADADAVVRQVSAWLLHHT